MPDRSLDEFASAGADESGDTATDTDSAAVKPATPTMRSVPEGAACAACGTVASRLWVDEERFVCIDCKQF